MYLIFDTETTDLRAPRLVQLAWQLHDTRGALQNHAAHIVRPEGFTIPPEATKIHGISTQRAKEEGIPLTEVLDCFESSVQQAQCLVAHNIHYDKRVLLDEYERLGKRCHLQAISVCDTMLGSRAYAAMPGARGYKWPRLVELYKRLFNKSFPSAHNAAFDVAATGACFFELLKRKVLSPVDAIFVENIAYEAPSFFENAKRNHLI